MNRLLSDSDLGTPPVHRVFSSWNSMHHLISPQRYGSTCVVYLRLAPVTLVNDAPLYKFVYSKMFAAQPDKVGLAS
jgi:hypothetical protein